MQQQPRPTSILKTDPGLSPPPCEDPPRLPPRRSSRTGPRIQLPALTIPKPMTPIPQTAGTANTLPLGWGVGMHPLTPVGGIPGGATGVPIGMAGALGRFNVYPNKASEFMFKQFAGFKDFTMNTAKIGLSHGEKTAFWLHGKVSSWSRRWFTHIFLFLVVFTYSLLGALLFVAIEGTNEDRYRSQIHEERETFLKTMYSLARNKPLVEDETMWTTEADKQLEVFATQLTTHIKKGEDNSRPEKIWTLWNAVFYCGTIYTTIGKHCS